MMSLPFLLIALAAPATGAGDPHAVLPPDLRQAVADYDRAQAQGDVVALRRLLADDYVLQNSSGKVDHKADFLRDATTTTFDPFTVEDETLRVWRDGALLAGVATLHGHSGGKEFTVRLRFADVWRKRDGHWQVAFTQATRVP